MSEILKIKYRTWYQGQPPQKIKLEIPGWGGKNNEHTDGSEAQPWHCTPFLDGSTYGLELLYPFDTECHVKIVEDKITFEGDFSAESSKTQPVKLPPFISFAAGHFGMTSCLDIQVPETHVLRIESHPSFYTDNTHTIPCVVPGHLQTAWWPKIFFVVFKFPLPGQTYIFKKNMPYAQIIVLPKKPVYSIDEMNETERNSRNLLDNKIVKNSNIFTKNAWRSNLGYDFDDKYKILSGIFAKAGTEGVINFVNNVKPKKTIKLKLIHENKTLQNKKKGT